MLDCRFASLICILICFFDSSVQSSIYYTSELSPSLEDLCMYLASLDSPCSIASWYYKSSYTSVHGTEDLPTYLREGKESHLDGPVGLHISPQEIVCFLWPEAGEVGDTLNGLGEPTPPDLKLLCVAYLRYSRMEVCTVAQEGASTSNFSEQDYLCGFALR